MEIRATTLLSSPVPNDALDMPSFFEGLDESGRVIGTLTIFAPTPDTGEITAFVPPDCRRQGVFTALLAEAEAVLRRHGYTRILFVCSGDSADGQAVAAHWALPLDHAEFFMVWNGSLPDCPPLDLRPATKAHISDLASLYMDTFHDSRDQALRFVETNLDLYRIAYRDGQLVGAANVQEGEVLGIYGVAIPSALQGQGFGKALMAALLRALPAQAPGKQITLEVDSTNHRAFRLYQSCGFIPVRREDYFLRLLAASS